MELPNLGERCLESTCNKLDFLPMKCDACTKIFCYEHYNYSNHNCPSAYKKNVQVPVCPLCNTLIPVPRDQLPDITVGAHIDNDCQSDPAKNRRRAYINKCSTKGCKIKEIVPVLCPECNLNYCLKHRHPSDHKCEGKIGVQRKRAANAALARRSNQNTSSSSNTKSIQGNLSEDEALARALALSMQDETQMSQEQNDRALAQALQTTANRRPNMHRNGDNNKCTIT